MATVQSLFFRPSRGYRKYTFNDDGSKTLTDHLYELDAVVDEQHVATATITKHPVEYGADIASHVIRQPMKITVNGVVTNSPSLKQLANSLPGGAKFASQAKGALTGSRARSAYEGLLELMNERKPVLLQTGLKAYENMVLTSISTPNDLQNNLRVRLVFEEIFVVGSEDEGAIQAVTSLPTEIDIVTAATALAGLGIALTPFAGFTGF